MLLLLRAWMPLPRCSSDRKIDLRASSRESQFQAHALSALASRLTTFLLRPMAPALSALAPAPIASTTKSLKLSRALSSGSPTTRPDRCAPREEYEEAGELLSAIHQRTRTMKEWMMASE